MRIKYRNEYKYAILLDKLRNGEYCISFCNLDTLYSGGGGGGKPLLPLGIFASDIPYLQMFYIALLFYAIALI